MRSSNQCRIGSPSLRSGVAVRPSSSTGVEVVEQRARRTARRRGGTRRRSRRRSGRRSRSARSRAFRLWIDAKTCSNRVGPCAADPLLAERRRRAARGGRSPGSGRGSPRGARRRAAAHAASCVAQPRVVERGHHGLAGAGRRRRAGCGGGPAARDSSICSSSRSWNGTRPQLDRAEDHVRARVGPSGALAARPSNCSGVVRHEVAARPVAVEHRAELGDDVGVARGRDPHVPLEAGHLRRVREVRRADVGGREAGVAVEEPGLGVQPRGAEVVGDPDVGAELGELDRALAARSSRCTSSSAPAAAGPRSQ